VAEASSRGSSPSEEERGSSGDLADLEGEAEGGGGMSSSSSRRAESASSDSGSWGALTSEMEKVILMLGCRLG
jgi:hypothetical protein